jgi:hypothetical protein
MAIETYYRLNPIDGEAEAAYYTQFMASNGFINLFKKRSASALDNRTSRDVLGHILKSNKGLLTTSWKS